MHTKSVSNQKLLENLKNKMAQDASLPLKDTAKNLVFGEGNPEAKIIFIGEAPGRFEDEKGLPFVGQAGKLLEKFLDTINLTRMDVFITSILHYRPPKNRPPKPQEIKSFKPYIDEIIKIIKPKIIVTLGRYSLNKFLPDKKISQVHGQVFDINWEGLKVKIIPMYHPAAALRIRRLIPLVEKDFQQIQKNISDKLFEDNQIN